MIMSPARSLQWDKMIADQIRETLHNNVLEALMFAFALQLLHVNPPLSDVFMLIY